MKIREAQIGDRDTLATLWMAFMHEMAGIDPRFVPSDDAHIRWRNDFPEWIHSDAHAIAVAENAGAAVGFASAQVWTPPPIYAAQRALYVDELYVEPPLRRQGVATRLIEHLQSWGRSKGLTRCRLQTLLADEPARAFWAHLGAVEYSLSLTLDLGTGR